MASPAAILQVFVNANTKAATTQLAVFDKQLQGTAASANATSAAMGGKMAKGAMLAKAGIAAAGVAAVVAGKQLYQLGKEFDEAYDTIRVGTGATGRELDKLKGNFRSVAKNVPNDFKEVGTAIADLNTRLGLTGKPLEDMAENMLHLSNITGDDLKGNIRAVARAFVDWEVEIPKQTEYLDGLFRLSQKSGASVSQLTDSVQKFGSPLRQLGFEFDEAASTFAAFERAGVNTQTMVPGLKLAIANLTRPTEGLAEQMGKLGIETGKPDKALRQVFELLGSSKQLSKVEKTGLAMDVFGKRAGADMAEAIKQGRFEVDKYMKVFNDKNGDSIRRAADETYDFSENAKILGNNLKIYLEPAANAVFVAVDKAVRALNQGIKELQGTSDKSTTVGEVLRVLTDIVYGLRKAFQVFFRTTKRMIEGTLEVIRGLARGVKSSFELIRALIKGDWRKAWQSAKGIVRGAIQAIGGVIKTVTAPVRSVFQGVVEIVQDKFESAYIAAVSFVNKILGVLRKIPGVKKLVPGAISLGFGEGSSKRGAVKRQRGGPINMGKASGDSVPAMLERGEYVLNRKAVRKIGQNNLDRLNFRDAPRFQRGGPIGMNVGGYVNKAVDHVPGLSGAKKVFGAVAKAANFYIKKLPSANLPDPISGAGPWVIGQVKDWLVKRLKSAGASSAELGAAKGDIRKVIALATGKYGLRVSSGFPLGTPGVHAPNSYHYQYGRAVDLSNGVNTPQMRNFSLAAASKWGGKMKEMFYDPLGWYIKNGSRVSGAIGGHSDHVHVAMQRGGSVGSRSRGKSGWVKTGFTVFDDAGGGYLGSLQKGKGYAELGTAYPYPPYGATGRGLIARALGMSGELPHKYPLDVKINGKIRRMYKRDRGYGQGDTYHSIDIYKDSWPFFGINQFSKGNAWIKPGKGKVQDTEKAKKEAERARREKARRKKVVERIGARGLKYKGRGELGKNAGMINRIKERIGVAERLATADFGPGGSEETEQEIAEQKKLYQQLFDLQKKRVKLILKAIKEMQRRIAAYRERLSRIRGKNDGGVYPSGKPPKADKKWKKEGFEKGIKNAGKTMKDLRGSLRGLVGITGVKAAMSGKFDRIFSGDLGDTNLTLKNLGVKTTRDAGDSELASLLREQLTISQRNLAIAQAQAPVFQQFMPKFHQGGIVQGRMGSEQPIMAQAGEGVFTREQMRAMGGAGNITVVIEDGAIDSNRIRVEVDGVLQDKISTVRRTTPNRRYSTR